MVLNKIVARFKDGSVIKGKTSNFSQDRTYFHLELVSGKKIKIDLNKLKIVEINKQDLKAAFFVKDFDGNKDHVETYDDTIISGGKKVQVKFRDGEVIIGYTLGYDPNNLGFFITPADKHSNNERIFVIKTATEEISFL